MLIGSFQHTVDVKGRIFIPSKLKADLGETFVVVRGMTKNLMVFPQKMFETFVAKYEQIPISDIEMQDLFRLFFASACECEVDKQGRVVLPQELRDYAGIEENVTIVGMITRLEIWATENYTGASEMSSEDYAKNLKKMAVLGI